MRLIGDAFLKLVRPALRDEAELGRFTRRVTTVCLAAAIVLDLCANLALGTSSWATVRSAAITAAISFLIAYPVVRTVARAHLDLYRAKAELEELSRRDPLTGLGNRRALMQHVATSDPAAMFMVIADIDRFKSINDTHGHVAGDAVIEATGRSMGAQLGDLGLVCRVGGEEFALVAERIQPADLRQRLLSFCQRLAAEPVRLGNREIAVTLSVGVAAGCPGGAFDEMYARADRALYVAKASGRDRICFDADLERYLDPPLPPDEILWVEPGARPVAGGRKDAAA